MVSYPFCKSDLSLLKLLASLMSTLPATHEEASQRRRHKDQHRHFGHTFEDAGCEYNMLCRPTISYSFLAISQVEIPLQYDTTGNAIKLFRASRRAHAMFNILAIWWPRPLHIHVYYKDHLNPLHSWTLKIREFFKYMLLAISWCKFLL